LRFAKVRNSLGLFSIFDWLSPPLLSKGGLSSVLGVSGKELNVNVTSDSSKSDPDTSDPLGCLGDGSLLEALQQSHRFTVGSGLDM
jgi:hypothetical protein